MGHGLEPPHCYTSIELLKQVITLPAFLNAKECEDNPFWIDPAYKKTQPKPIFQEVDPDEPPEKLTRSDTFG